MTTSTVSSDFRQQLDGFGLTTAKIIYRFPDRPAIICPNYYVWQNYDLFPKFPKLNKFLEFWQRELDGPLFKVEVAHSKLLKPAELRVQGKEFRLH